MFLAIFWLILPIAKKSRASPSDIALRSLYGLGTSIRLPRPRNNGPRAGPTAPQAGEGRTSARCTTILCVFHMSPYMGWRGMLVSRPSSPQGADALAFTPSGSLRVFPSVQAFHRQRFVSFAPPFQVPAASRPPSG